LEQHINILVQPRQLEQLSRRLKVVTGELERVQELQAKDATSSGISADAENKVSIAASTYVSMFQYRVTQ